MKQSNQIPKYPVLFFVGGLVYYSIEIVYRGYSHPSMFILGGMCFILCGLVNELFSWDTPLIKQQAICSLIITLLEFVFGIILNVCLNQNIWDYSNIPFNVMGQICLPFTIIWFFLSLPAIMIDDYLRFLIWKEEKPRYRLV